MTAALCGAAMFCSSSGVQAQDVAVHVGLDTRLVGHRIIDTGVPGADANSTTDVGIGIDGTGVELGVLLGDLVDLGVQVGLRHRAQGGNGAAADLTSLTLLAQGGVLLMEGSPVRPMLSLRAGVERVDQPDPVILNSMGQPVEYVAGVVYDTFVRLGARAGVRAFVTERMSFDAGVTADYLAGADRVDGFDLGFSIGLSGWFGDAPSSGH